MFTRLACNDPFAFVPVLSLVVVGIIFHRVVPCSPVILIRISTLSPVVSVSPALAPATLGVERMMVFIVRFIVLGYRVSITRSMESKKSLYVVAPPFVCYVPTELIVFAATNLSSGISTVSVSSVLIVPVASATEGHGLDLGRKESKLLLELNHHHK